MKRYIIVCLMLIAMVGCSKESADNSASASAGKPAPAAAVAAETPSQAVKTCLEAIRNRRYAEFRDMLSQRSLTNLSEAAKSSNTNVDQALKRIIDQDAQDMAANNFNTFETRNEDIRGDRATIEAKATNAPKFARFSFVKENGLWKINIDETAVVE